jgi:hypothetical protein
MLVVFEVADSSPAYDHDRACPLRQRDGAYPRGMAWRADRILALASAVLTLLTPACGARSNLGVPGAGGGASDAGGMTSACGVVSASVGDLFTCAVRADGTVRGRGTPEESDCSSPA